MPSKRIIIVVTHLHDGGAQYVAGNLAERLGARGHEVEVWFLYQKTAQFWREVKWRVILPTSKVGLLGHLVMFVRLVMALRKARPDAVISNLPLGNVVGQVAARLAGVPQRIAVQHTEAWTYQPIMRWLDRFTGSFGFYTSNVTVSETVKRSFSGCPPAYQRRLVVIPNGIVFQRTDLSQSEARRKLGLPAEGTYLIVVVGRLSAQKNQAVLVRALAKIPDAHLAIAGEGELRSELEGLARRADVSDRLHLLGNIDRSDMANFLGAGDVWAFPSIYEGLSLSLLEALNAGLAIVASNIPSNTEVLEADQQGPAAILLPPDDEDGWREALTTLSQDRAARGEYARRARDLASLFTLERMIDRYEELLNDLGS